MNKPDLSVIILNYNTKDLLRDCLQSLEKVKGEVSFEVIVSDNGSTDGSPQMIKKEFPWVRLIEGRRNLGFAAGNNRAKKLVRGDYILFLNSDTQVRRKALKESLNYLKTHKEVGALTCKIVLPDGKLDKDARRSFPTPWVALTHLVLKLDRVFPRSALFSRYWYGYLDENATHEVDAIQGAFFLVRKKILDQVGWFDEDYFLDGEDIDLSWQIKEAGWKIVYYPKVSILHLKGVTKGKNKARRGKVPLKERLKYRLSGVRSMEIFYRKRLWARYPMLVNYLVLTGIKMLKLARALVVIFK